MGNCQTRAPQALPARGSDARGSPYKYLLVGAGALVIALSIFWIRRRRGE